MRSLTASLDMLLSYLLFLPLVLPVCCGAVVEERQPAAKGVIPLRRRPVRAIKRSLDRRQDRIVDLGLADGGQEFIAQVAIGTPWTTLQVFDLPVDTGSSDTWVASNNFTCENSSDDCDVGIAFAPTSSFVPLNASLENRYGDGVVMGEFGIDTITIGGSFSSVNARLNADLNRLCRAVCNTSHCEFRPVRFHWRHERTSGPWWNSAGKTVVRRVVNAHELQPAVRADVLGGTYRAAIHARAVAKRWIPRARRNSTTVEHHARRQMDSGAHACLQRWPTARIRLLHC